MTGYLVCTTPRFCTRYDAVYKQMQKLLSGREGETPEGIVIPKLHRMWLQQRYARPFSRYGKSKPYALPDYQHERPGKQDPKAHIHVVYGRYREPEFYSARLREHEDEVALAVATDLNMRDGQARNPCGAFAVVAGVMMFGAMWSSRGVFVDDF